MAFDAELYLRGNGEELLAGPAGDSQPGSSALANAAAALVAVRALSAPRAEAVLDEDPVLAQINAAGTDEPDRRRTLAYPANLADYRQTMSGELRFFPLLDPEATRLDLMPSTPTTRAVIAIPLAWGQATA